MWFVYEAKSNDFCSNSKCFVLLECRTGDTAGGAPQLRTVRGAKRRGAFSIRERSRCSVRVCTTERVELRRRVGRGRALAVAHQSGRTGSVPSAAAARGGWQVDWNRRGREREQDAGWRHEHEHILGRDRAARKEPARERRCIGGCRRLVVCQRQEKEEEQEQEEERPQAAAFQQVLQL